jgi:hypothetical protein
MRASIQLLNELVDRFAKAAELNRSTPGRSGSVVYLSPASADEVVVAGDLHGNRDNFNKLLRAADLEHHPQRHLVLQEVVHGGPTYPNGGCMSHLLLEDVAALKLRYPDRFHLLLCNHELAECNRDPIIKSGVSQNFQFACGLEYAYGKAAAHIADSYRRFIRTCPLALRVHPGVFISHSLPDAEQLRRFDVKVFSREYYDADLIAGGSAYALVWGRQYDAPHVHKFAQLVDARVLITGHEPTPDGFQLPSERQLILDASDAECLFCLVPVGRQTTAAELAAALIRI